MFRSSKAASAYKSVGLESRVANSSNQELVVMLLEGCLERVSFARRAITTRDVSARVEHIGRAIQILSEGLRTHLDLQRGGELAANLDQLYHYCIVRLMEGNLKADLAALDEVTSLLEPICEAWRRMGREQAPHASVDLTQAVHQATRRTGLVQPAVVHTPARPMGGVGGFGFSAYAGV